MMSLFNPFFTPIFGDPYSEKEAFCSSNKTPEVQISNDSFNTEELAHTVEPATVIGRKNDRLLIRLHSDKSIREICPTEIIKVVSN